MNHQARRRRTNMLTVMGVDIGQKRDPTAIAVAEIEYRDSDLPGRKKESHYLVRHLERLPLGTPYPQVSGRIGEICQRLKNQTGSRPSLFVDATGVGQGGAARLSSWPISRPRAA